MRSDIYNWIKNIQSGIYPSTCLLCWAPGIVDQDICAGCIEDLPAILHACRRCALPLEGGSRVPLCGACQRRPPPYDSAFVAFPYSFPIDRLISRLKFKAKLTHARLLGQLMTDILKASVPESEWPETIIPVPLHSRRLYSRGFNQSLELARYVARDLKIPLQVEAVRRVRLTSPQTGLSEKERRKNVRRAFEMSSKLESRHVAIMDDVITTGSTAAELTRTLKRAGIKRVDVWALARTV
jgi:ComF family protein